MGDTIETVAGNREIDRDALALRHSLGSSIPELRDGAFRYLERVIWRHEGRAMQICEALGVDKRTYHRWRQDYPELERIHSEARAEAGLPPDWSRRPAAES